MTRHGRYAQGAVWGVSLFLCLRWGVSFILLMALIFPAYKALVNDSPCLYMGSDKNKTQAYVQKALITD